MMDIIIINNQAFQCLNQFICLFEQYYKKMETAEEIRLKVAQLQLAALQTEYCNANWTYNVKLKSLRDDLQQKNRKQNMLINQLAALKKCYLEHQNEVKEALAQATKSNKCNDRNEKDKQDNPNVSSKLIRQSPKNYAKGLFFRVNKEQNNKASISPSFTKASSVSSWQNKKLGIQQSIKNPQQTSTSTLIKQNITLQSVGSQKTFECQRKLQQLKQINICGSLAKTIQEKAYKSTIKNTKQHNSPFFRK